MSTTSMKIHEKAQLDEIKARIVDFQLHSYEQRLLLTTELKTDIAELKDMVRRFIQQQLPQSRSPYNSQSPNPDPDNRDLISVLRQPTDAEESESSPDTKIELAINSTEDVIIHKTPVLETKDANDALFVNESVSTVDVHQPKEVSGGLVKEVNTSVVVDSDRALVIYKPLDWDSTSSVTELALSGNDFMDPFLLDVNAKIIVEKYAESGVVTSSYVLECFCTPSVCENVQVKFSYSEMSSVPFKSWKIHEITPGGPFLCDLLDIPPPVPPDLLDKPGDSIDFIRNEIICLRTLTVCENVSKTFSVLSGDELIEQAPPWPPDVSRLTTTEKLISEFREWMSMKRVLYLVPETGFLNDLNEEVPCAECAVSEIVSANGMVKFFSCHPLYVCEYVRMKLYSSGVAPSSFIISQGCVNVSVKLKRDESRASKPPPLPSDTTLDDLLSYCRNFSGFYCVDLYCDIAFRDVDWDYKPVICAYAVFFWGDGFVIVWKWPWLFHMFFNDSKCKSLTLLERFLCGFMMEIVYFCSLKLLQKRKRQSQLVYVRHYSLVQFIQGSRQLLSKECITVSMDMICLEKRHVWAVSAISMTVVLKHDLTKGSKVKNQNVMMNFNNYWLSGSVWSYDPGIHVGKYCVDFVASIHGSCVWYEHMDSFNCFPMFLRTSAEKHTKGEILESHFCILISYLNSYFINVWGKSLMSPLVAETAAFALPAKPPDRDHTICVFGKSDDVQSVSSEAVEVLNLPSDVLIPRDLGALTSLLADDWLIGFKNTQFMLSVIMESNVTTAAIEFVLRSVIQVDFIELCRLKLRHEVIGAVVVLNGLLVVSHEFYILYRVFSAAAKQHYGLFICKMNKVWKMVAFGIAYVNRGSNCEKTFRLVKYDATILHPIMSYFHDTPDELEMKRGIESDDCLSCHLPATCNLHERLLTGAEVKHHSQSGEFAAQSKSFMSSLSYTLQEKINAVFIAHFDGVGKGFVKKVIIAAATGQTDITSSQVVLLRAIMIFCEKASIDAVMVVPLTLKKFYDSDILEEDFDFQSIVNFLNPSLQFYKVPIKPFEKFVVLVEKDRNIQAILRTFNSSLCKLVGIYAEILASRGLVTTAMKDLRLWEPSELSFELHTLLNRMALTQEGKGEPQTTTIMVCPFVVFFAWFSWPRPRRY